MAVYVELSRTFTVCGVAEVDGPEGGAGARRDVERSSVAEKDVAAAGRRPEVVHAHVRRDVVDQRLSGQVFRPSADNARAFVVTVHKQRTALGPHSTTPTRHPREEIARVGRKWM